MGMGPLGKTRPCFQPCRCVSCCGVLGPFSAEELCNKDRHDRVFNSPGCCNLSKWTRSWRTFPFWPTDIFEWKKTFSWKILSSPHHALHWHSSHTAGCHSFHKDINPRRASTMNQSQLRNIKIFFSPVSAMNVTTAIPHQLLWWWHELIDNSKSYGNQAAWKQTCSFSSHLDSTDEQNGREEIAWIRHSQSQFTFYSPFMPLKEKKHSIACINLKIK